MALENIHMNLNMKSRLTSHLNCHTAKLSQQPSNAQPLADTKTVTSNRPPENAQPRVSHKQGSSPGPVPGLSGLRMELTNSMF